MSWPARWGWCEMASLAQGIVIRNEFTVGGSRGNSPGRYLLNYMARKGASENMTPTLARSERIEAMQDKMRDVYGRRARGEPRISDYVTRYMARADAADMAYMDGETEPGVLREDFRQIQGYSGLAFGPRSLSLSHEEVLEYARMLQSEYEKGKPVMKTVISFSTDYLKEMGVLPEGFQVTKRGDFYGKTDQAKLRLAIQKGMENIKHEYSDLDYIGVVQVDTEHLHCHLASVDKGVGKHFTKDGEQRGMISAPMRAAIRRGIDNSLTDSQRFKPLSIQMEAERRDTLVYIRQFTQRVIEERGLPQFLLACLPKDDKSLWRASFNAEPDAGGEMEITRGGHTRHVTGNMRRANEIVRSYVTDLLNRPDSGFEQALTAKHEQLMAQRDRGDFDEYYVYRKRGKKSVRTRLTPDEAVRDREERFTEEVTERGMNTVYDVLKTVDLNKARFRTPLMDAMAMPYEEMANFVKEDRMIEFGFRLRSYAGRLDYHKDRYERVNEVIHQYEDGAQETYNPESKVVYDFLKVEQEYNHAVMAKYQTFLHFYHPKEEYQDDLDDLEYKRTRSSARHAMQEDKELLSERDAAEREKKGYEKYGLRDAGLLDQQNMQNMALFKRLIEDEDNEYKRGVRNFKEKMAGIGMLYDEQTGEVSRGSEFSFDEVKAYDLHHMGYDYTYDFKIASENIDRFADMANRRYNAWRRAQDYLDRSGQPDALYGVIDAEDIRIAKETADSYRQTEPVYHTRYDSTAQRVHDPSTAELDDAVYDRLTGKTMMNSLKQIMQSLSGPESGQEEGENYDEDFMRGRITGR